MPCFCFLLFEEKNGVACIVSSSWAYSSFQHTYTVSCASSYQIKDQDLVCRQGSRLNLVAVRSSSHRLRRDLSKAEHLAAWLPCLSVPRGSLLHPGNFLECRFLNFPAHGSDSV